LKLELWALDVHNSGWGLGVGGKLLDSFKSVLINDFNYCIFTIMKFLTNSFEKIIINIIIIITYINFMNTNNNVRYESSKSYSYESRVLCTTISFLYYNSLAIKRVVMIAQYCAVR